MFRKSISLFLIVSFLAFNVCPSFAQSAIVLSDDDLDQVHAGGLNFDLNGFLGSAANTVTNTASNSLSSNTSTPEAGNSFNNNSSFGVKITDPSSTASATSPNTTSAVPFTPIQPKSLIEPVTNIFSQNDANPLKTELPSSSELPFEDIATLNTTNPNSPSADSINVASAPNQNNALGNNAPVDLSLNSINVTDSGQAGLNSLVNINAAGSTVPVQFNMAVLNNSIVENLNFENILNTYSVASNAAGFNINNSKTSELASASDQVNTSDINAIDAVVQTNGFDTASLYVNQTSPLAQNSINVTDSGQAGLNSLVNINAAGSNVPVQFNMAVLNNSTVKNLNFSNFLNLYEVNSK